MKLFARVFLVSLVCLSVCYAVSYQCMALEDVPAASVESPLPTEPTTSEPATSEPATSEPATSEPATSEPATSEPAISEPAISEPAVSEPTTSEPATSEPEIIYQPGVSIRDLEVNPPNLTVDSAIIHIRFCLIVLTFYYLPLFIAVVLIWQFFKWVYGLCIRAV